MKTEMKAAVLHAPGDLRTESRAVPRPLGDDAALIKVRAAGICGSDLPRIMETGTYHFPTIPGHEFCGEIAEISPSDKFKVGDRVLVAPIMPCFKCEACEQGNYGLCEDYNYLGSRTDGGFAEYVVAPVKNLIPLPETVPFTIGAMVEPTAVTLHGLMKLSITPGDSLTVLGCGTIGLMAIALAGILGVTTVYATDISEEKLAVAESLGATPINGMNGNPVAAIMELTKNKGTDLVVETAGSHITQVQALSVCKKQGQVLYLGTAHHDVIIPPADFEKIVPGRANPPRLLELLLRPLPRTGMAGRSRLPGQ